MYVVRVTCNTDFYDEVIVVSQSQQAQTQVRIDNLSWDLTAKSCDVTVRNTGSVSATIESVAIRKSASGATLYYVHFTGTNSITTGTTLPFVWTQDGASAPSGFIAPLIEYVVRVTTTTGFQYEMTATSPSA